MGRKSGTIKRFVQRRSFDRAEPTPVTSASPSFFVGVGSHRDEEGSEIRSWCYRHGRSACHHHRTEQLSRDPVALCRVRDCPARDTSARNLASRSPASASSAVPSVGSTASSAVAATSASGSPPLSMSPSSGRAMLGVSVARRVVPNLHSVAVLLACPECDGTGTAEQVLLRELSDRRPVSAFPRRAARCPAARRPAAPARLLFAPAPRPGS